MQKHALYLLPVLILITGVGCGRPYQTKKKSSANSAIYDSDDNNSIVQTGATTAGQAPVKVNVEATGYSGTFRVQVPAGRVLKVAFIPGKQSTQADDGKFYPYSVLSVYIGVGKKVQPTAVLYNGYSGNKAQQSATIDLSSALDSSCAANSTCRQNVVIEVSKAQSDDGCYSVQGQYCASGYTYVPEGHPWNGILIIQNDDTTAI